MGRTEHHSADVGRAIAEQLTAEGKIPRTGSILIEYAVVARIRVLHDDGSDETVHEHSWSRGVDPDSHFALGHRMSVEAQRRDRGLGA